MKLNSTRLTASGDIVSAGRAVKLHKLTFGNNGTSGSNGVIEIRDATSPAGDTGTLRWSSVIMSATAGALVSEDFPEDGLHMNSGIRVTIVGATNVVIWVVWS